MPKIRPSWSWNTNGEGMAPPIKSNILRSINHDEAFQGGGKVAVIDSGIENSHVAVGDAVKGWCEPIADENEMIRYEFDRHSDLFGHGTACAGIIHKIAPEAELYSIRVLGKKLSGKGAIFAAALRWAIDNEIDVVNMSLGTSKTKYFALFHALVDETYYKRVILVTAANNSPRISYPSLYSTVISTACYDGIDENGLLDFYYSPNPPVEFGARGIDIDVAWLGGAYMKVTGNSFTAPSMTGIVT